MLRLLPAAAATALALSAVMIAAEKTTDTEDHYKPAGAALKATSTKAVSTSTSGVSLTCTNSTTSGKTPATGLGLFTMSPPKFNDGYAATGKPKPCTDSARGTDVVATGGTWNAGFVDEARDETSPEPNTGDTFRIVIPKAGAVDHTFSPGVSDGS